MNSRPKLLAIAGPLRGQIIELRNGTTTLGRDASSDVCLPLASVSRKHCELVLRNCEVMARDLDSLNGTFVNGLPIRERTLVHGDQIEMGDAAFLYSVEFEAEAAAVRDEELQVRATVELHLSGREPLLPSKWTGAASQATAHLRSLYQLSTALLRVRNVEEIQHELLKSALQVIPLERGTILLRGEDSEQIVRKLGWSTERGLDTDVAVSSSITLRVMR